jgi:hypothetical protein
LLAAGAGFCCGGGKVSAPRVPQAPSVTAASKRMCKGRMGMALDQNQKPKW